MFQTEDLKTLIAQVLEDNDSRCLDDATDRQVVTDALTNAMLHKALENLDSIKQSLCYSVDGLVED